LRAQALAQREEAVRNGKLTTIVFIRERNSKGQEVSGYIDFAFRLKVRVAFAARSHVWSNTTQWTHGGRLQAIGKTRASVRRAVGKLFVVPAGALSSAGFG
jgi:hypothetical protein